MESIVYRNQIFFKETIEESGHCSECRDKLFKGDVAFQTKSEARPKLCVHCVEHLDKMAKFREDFLDRLNKNGWFNDQDS